MDAARRAGDWVASTAAGLVERYKKLGFYGKVAIWCWVALHFIVLGALWIITPARIFGWMATWAEGLREMRFGWLLLLGLLVLTSLPPLFGYGTCQTLAGFAFGAWHGWLLGVAGCLLGGVTSFLIVRRMLPVFAPLLQKNHTFRALATAVRAKGLPLVVLIRLCPFPFPYSNAFFASIESVSLLQFFVATLAITPKLFLHVWVGSRMYLFADPESRNGMDSNTKIVNGLSMVFGTLLGIATSWYLYRLTMQYVQEVVLEDGEDLEAGLIDDIDELLDGEDDSDRDDDGEDLDADKASPSMPLLQTNPARPTPSHTFSAPVVGRSSMEGGERKFAEGGRQSEDRWEENFSDFDEELEEEEEDPLGLGLTTLRQPAVRMESMPELIDKRRD